MSDYVTKTNLLSALGRFKENTDDLYETKADANAMKNALEDSEQRIENLEQAVSGSLVTTNTDATQKNTKSITSANTILPWALLNRVGARAVSWNQLVQNGNFASGDGWVLESGVTASFNDNVATISSTIENNGIRGSVDFITGHKYLVSADVSTESAITVRLGSNSSSGVQLSFTPSVFNQFINYCGVLTALNDYYTFFIFAASPYSNLKVRNVTLFDLTAMNEASLTADQFRSKFPATYYPNNNGQIIPLNPSAFKVVKFNQFNGSFLQGTINANTGEVSGSSYRVVSDMFKAIGGEEYSFNVNTESSGVVTVFECAEYDPQQNFIKITTITGRESSLPLSSNTAYIRVSFKKSDGNAIGPSELNGVFCANIFCSKNGQYEPYSEQTIDTSFTSDYKYVNENCHDYSENVLVDGQKMREEHRIVGEVDLGDMEWAYESWAGQPNFTSTKLRNIIKAVANNVVPNLLCSMFLPVTFNENRDMVKLGLSVSESGSNVDCRVTNGYTNATDFTNWVRGKKLYYELATPTTSLHNDPIPNFPCEDGTTITAITPQTDLVNAIDVPSTIAYMTKIAS